MKQIYGEPKHVLMALNKLGKPMYEGVQDKPTRNSSGEIFARRAKNKRAKATRKLNRKK